MIYPVGSTVYSRSMRWGQDADQYYQGSPKGGIVVDTHTSINEDTAEMFDVYTAVQFHENEGRMQPCYHRIPETDIDHKASDDIINKASIKKLAARLNKDAATGDPYRHLVALLALSVAVNTKATA